MSEQTSYKVGEITYDGMEFASKLRLDLITLIDSALLSADMPTRSTMSREVEVKAGPLSGIATQLDLHQDIMPVAQDILKQLKADIPTLKGSSLQILNGFGAGSLFFESTNHEALKKELRSLRAELKSSPVALKSIHTALTPLRVQEAALV